MRDEVEVEVRPSTPTTDPRSGWPLTVPPLVILWVGERPLAVRLRAVVAISRFPTNARLANLVEGEAAAQGFAVERMPEAGPLAPVLAAAAAAPRGSLATATIRSARAGGCRG